MGDVNKRAFTYFVLTGARFMYASAIRLVVLKFILSMSVRPSLAICCPRTSRRCLPACDRYSAAPVFTWHSLVSLIRLPCLCRC